MKKGIPTKLASFLTGHVSAPESKLANYYLSSGKIIPQYPVIFIPGLGFDGKYWSESKIFSILINKAYLTYGGDFKIKIVGKNIQIEDTKIKPANIYTISFSNTELAITQQGRELSVVINRVKELNKVKKVILIGHSMGGLAAREYLQSNYYANDVATYMSIGTPHLGSNFRVQNPVLELIPKKIRDKVWKVDIKSDAVRDLRPNSIYLNGGLESTSPDEYYSKDINLNGKTNDLIIGLNDFKARPLPKDVKYVCIVGGGNLLLTTGLADKYSDGIVNLRSQDLNEVPGVNVHALVLLSEKDHFSQADDVWMLLQAMRMFRELP